MSEPAGNPRRGKRKAFSRTLSASFLGLLLVLAAPAINDAANVAALAEKTEKGLKGEKAPTAETLWAGLIYATNDTPATPFPPFPAARVELGRKVKGVFNYTQAKLISERREALTDGKEHLLPLGKTFRLYATRRRTADGIATLWLRLFRDERMLVETEVQLGRNSPLLLRGPLSTKGGQLIIALQVE